MKQDIKEAVLIAIASYILFAFIMASVNCFIWGAIIRAVYAAITLSLIVINKKLNVQGTV